VALAVKMAAVVKMVQQTMVTIFVTVAFMVVEAADLVMRPRLAMACKKVAAAA